MYIFIHLYIIVYYLVVIYFFNILYFFRLSNTRLIKQSLRLINPRFILLKNNIIFKRIIVKDKIFIIFEFPSNQMKFCWRRRAIRWFDWKFSRRNYDLIILPGNNVVFRDINNVTKRMKMVNIFIVFAFSSNQILFADEEEI